MWIIIGIQRSTKRVRQHGDLSYWVSDDEVRPALGASYQTGSGPWVVTPALESLLVSRQKGGLQANLDPAIGALKFFVEHRANWNPLWATTWFDDEAESPENPAAAARAHGRDIIWHIEGFDPARLFMVEDFELSHRISEAEILAAPGNPPTPYYGGLPPTEALVNLASIRIGLQLNFAEIDYQVNASSRYGLR